MQTEQFRVQSVQRAVQPARIIALALTPALDAVRSLAVFERGPTLESPTTGAVVRDEL